MSEKGSNCNVLYKITILGPFQEMNIVIAIVQHNMNTEDDQKLQVSKSSSSLMSRLL